MCVCVHVGVCNNNVGVQVHVRMYAGGTVINQHIFTRMCIRVRVPYCVDDCSDRCFRTVEICAVSPHACVYIHVHRVYIIFQDPVMDVRFDKCMYMYMYIYIRIPAKLKIFIKNVIVAKPIHVHCISSQVQKGRILITHTCMYMYKYRLVPKWRGLARGKLSLERAPCDCPHPARESSL